MLRSFISSNKTKFAAAWLALLLLGSVLPAQAQSSPQEVELRRVGQALDRVVGKAKAVTAAEDYGFMQGGCVFGVMLSPGKSVSETFQLKAGGSYVFIGGGDSTTRDADILISDGAGRVVKQDTGADASPVVLFEPKKSGTYKMTLRLKSSQSGKAFCAATVLTTGGAKLPIERISQAARKVGLASQLFFSASKGGRFNQDSNTWALYGVVLGSKQYAQSDYKRYNAGNRVFVAVGDDRIKDLDLYLLDGNKKPVAGDNKNGAVAALAYKTKPGNYSIAAQNNYSTGPSLVLGILIDLPANFDVEKFAQQAMQPASNRPGKTPAAASPVAGSWQGQWQDDDGMQSGTVAFNVSNTGALSGQMYNGAVDTTVPINGTIKPDGTFFFKYSFQGTNYIAKGTFQTDGQNLAGRAGFSTDGRTAFSGGAFQLQRSETLQNNG